MTHPSPAKVVLAGGNGALGRRLAADFADRGYEVVILTRSPRPEIPHRQVAWDGETVGSWAGELSEAVVINLAGELVDRRPTPANVKLLTSSRVRPTTALSEAAAGLAQPPSVWIQSSTAAIYGDRGDEALVEDSPVGDGPPQMADVATAWEDAAASTAAKRTVFVRAGIVLDPATPALDRLTSLARWGLGGRVGSGRQWVSWLHIADYLAIIRFLVEQSRLSGVVHASSPRPVRNADLMTTLRKVLRRPPAPPTPAFAVRLGAPLLGTDAALALLGRRCLPARLLDEGFEFTFPDLPDALNDLLRRE